MRCKRSNHNILRPLTYAARSNIYPNYHQNSTVEILFIVASIQNPHCLLYVQQKHPKTNGQRVSLKYSSIWYKVTNKTTYKTDVWICAHLWQINQCVCVSYLDRYRNHPAIINNFTFTSNNRYGVFSHQQFHCVFNSMCGFMSTSAWYV